MLEFIRNRAQTWIAWVIVALIIIPFALWGIGEYFTGDTESGVAEVGGEKISKATFQQAFTQQRDRLREMLGKRYDPAVYDEMVRKDVINSLVNQEVLYQAAQEQGMRISDATLGQVIHSFKEFQRDGQFDKELYNQTLSMQGINSAYYEQQMRRSFLGQQFYVGVANSVIIPDYEVENILRLKNQQRDVGYVAIPRNNFISSIEVKSDQIKEYYVAHQDDYMTPEMASLEYLELSAAEIAKSIELSDAKLKEMYEVQKQNYAAPEERRVSHILIEAGSDASSEEVASAKGKAEDLLKKIQEGASFAELAKQNSDDPGSADFGGDLGFIKRGEMVPEFDKVAFELSQGGVSSVVRTDFGFHIIKVEEIKGGEVPGFDVVREQLAKDVRNQEAEKLYYDRAEILSNLTYEHPESLGRAAEELNLKLQETALFSREGGTGIASNDTVINAAFSEEVLKEGLNSEVLDLGSNHVVVVRIKDHKSKEIRPLAEVSDAIKLKLQIQKADQLTEELGQKIVAALSDGSLVEEVVKQHGLQWNELGLISRESTEAPPALVAEAFELSPPKDAKPSIGSVRIANGDFAVMRVATVQYPEVANLSKEESDAMKRNLENSLGNQEYAGFLDELKDKVEIVVRIE